MVICSFGSMDESLFIRSSGVYLHVVLDSFEVVLKVPFGTHETQNKVNT